MKTIALLSVSVILAVCFNKAAAQTTSQSPFRAVSVPKESTLPVIAHQPNCPLRLFHVDTRAYLEGGGKVILKYRNESNKPIKSYKIAYINTFSAGKEFILGGLPPDEVVRPSEEIVFGNPHLDKLVELNKDIRESLHLGDTMQSVTIFLVVRVEFADGSIFEDEELYKRLKTFMSKVANCTEK